LPHVTIEGESDEPPIGAAIGAGWSRQRPGREYGILPTWSVVDGETNSRSTGIFSTSSVSLVRSAARSYRPPGSDELIEPRSISGTRLNHFYRVTAW